MKSHGLVTFAGTCCHRRWFARSTTVPLPRSTRNAVAQVAPAWAMDPGTGTGSIVAWHWPRSGGANVVRHETVNVSCFNPLAKIMWNPPGPHFGRPTISFAFPSNDLILEHWINAAMPQRQCQACAAHRLRSLI